MEKKSDRKLVSFRLPEELIENLRARADQENISVTELVYRLLRQGLQENVDDRIATLEAEIRELRQAKQVNFSNAAPPPVYMLPQGLVARECDLEIKQRIDKLEALVKEVLNDRITTQSRAKPFKADNYSEDEE